MRMFRRWPKALTNALILLLFLLLMPADSLANWMYLGMAAAGAGPSIQKPTDGCGAVPGLVYQQRRLCQDNPGAMPYVGQGVGMSIQECQYQFRYDRWNCTTTTNTSVFGQVLTQNTRETAFVYAVTSAGVVHTVTRACSAGNLTDCTCDNTYAGQTSPEGWQWGGCSDNVDYGVWFARTFIDAPEDLRRSRSQELKPLINLHNNNVGRQVVSATMKLKCRCHGVSGTCAVKTCWRRMAPFREVGEVLKDKYDVSTQLAPRSKRKLRRRQKRSRRIPIQELEMVHVDRSPNYCRKDLGKAIPGTRGRECNKDTNGADSCELLCCGRGYNTEVVRYVERCFCKFIWCCEVKCKSCETMVDRHTCK